MSDGTLIQLSSGVIYEPPVVKDRRHFWRRESPARLAFEAVGIRGPLAGEALILASVTGPLAERWRTLAAGDFVTVTAAPQPGDSSPAMRVEVVEIAPAAKCPVRPPKRMFSW